MKVGLYSVIFCETNCKQNVGDKNIFVIARDHFANAHFRPTFETEEDVRNTRGHIEAQF